MLRKRILIIIAAALVCLPALCNSISKRAEYFYLNACESCNPEERFEETYQRVTGNLPEECSVVYHNVYSDAGRAAYEEATNSMTEEERRLPLLIVDGVAYAGDTNITAGLKENFGEGNTDYRSILYFLTAPACNSCIQARHAVEALPAILALHIDERSVSSPVEIREITISTEPDIAQALFQYYNVPDHLRYAPAVFMGSTHLCGADQIAEQLPVLLKSGAALGTPLFLAQAAADSSPQLSGTTLLWGSVIAGIATGFNPCALSMLLVFAGALLALRRSPLLPGLMYLAGKLLVFCASGFFAPICGYATLPTGFPWQPAS